MAPLKNALRDALKVLAVFCGIGPFVGLVIFALGSSVLAVTSGTKDGFWIGPFLLIYGVIFAHFVGIAWAAAAASAAIAMSFLLKRRPRWIGPASGLLSFAASTYFDGELIRGPVLVADGQTPADYWTGFALVVAATHIGAASVSWLMARRWLGKVD